MYAGNWDGTVTPKISLNSRRPLIIAGPCMLESLELGLKVGSFMKELCAKHNLSYVFKSSYDKANRTSKNAVRGPGLSQGLASLEEISKKLSVPILTDVHSPEQATAAGKVCDILQIPAFLCAQRELLIAAAKTGKTIQIKKGQHTAPEELLGIAEFVREQGNNRVILCERGAAFGYNNLVVDYRTLLEFRTSKNAAAFDCTHAAQLPGGGGGFSSGLRHVVPALARAAVAVGVDALFLEVHEDPDKALSDAATQLNFELAQQVVQEAARLADAMANS